jgi:hypothetical protein
MSTPGPARSDPIGERHYKPLQIADCVSELSFYVAAALSFVALLVDRADDPSAYDLVQIGFLLSVLTTFFTGVAIRLYWRPNAEDKRRGELISNATNVPLSVDRTEGYYNNEALDPMRRLGLIIMENSLFSKSISLKMLFWVRILVGVYVVFFIIALLYRKTDLALLAVAAQAIFSEQLLSRWLRLEWFRKRCESVFEQTYSLFQQSPSKKIFFAKTLELYGLYETGKANAGVALSSKIFDANNQALSAEWEKIKATLGV